LTYSLSIICPHTFYNFIAFLSHTRIPLAILARTFRAEVLPNVFHIWRSRCLPILVFSPTSALFDGLTSPKSGISCLPVSVPIGMKQLVSLSFSLSILPRYEAIEKPLGAYFPGAFLFPISNDEHSCHPHAAITRMPTKISMAPIVLVKPSSSPR
jgi:hypothetical protein